MVFAGWLLIESMTVIHTVLRLTEKYAIVCNVTVGPTPTLPDLVVIPEEPTIGTSKEHMSVYDYGRNELCRSFEGKKLFYEVMKTKFCDLTLMFTANHVVTLCEKRDETLDSWVAALFDLDDNGYISHQELHK